MSHAYTVGHLHGAAGSAMKKKRDRKLNVKLYCNIEFTGIRDRKLNTIQHSTQLLHSSVCLPNTVNIIYHVHTYHRSVSMCAVGTCDVDLTKVTPAACMRLIHNKQVYRSYTLT